MTERPVGVTDQTSGAGIADVRTRERTVSGNTVAEQYVIPIRERVLTAVVLFSIQGTVSATAQTAATGGFFWIANHVSSGLHLAIRRVNFSSQHGSALATPTSPRIQLIRCTFTGTPTGATVTGAKTRSADSPGAGWSVRSAITG